MQVLVFSTGQELALFLDLRQELALIVDEGKDIVTIFRRHRYTGFESG
jgi:hypothetical protein